MKKKMLIIIPAVILLSILIAVFIAGRRNDSVNSDETVTEKVERADILASYVCGENLVGTLDSNGLLVISGTGMMDDYLSKPAPWESSASSIKALVVEDGVTGIGENAFSSCYSLEKITLPDTVTRIGYFAFVNTAYFINPGNRKNKVLYIGNHLIEADGNTSRSYTVREGTRTIAAYAFSDCASLKNITLPDSLTSIGEYAFNDCTSLKKITFPEGMKSIGDYAFKNCSSLDEINLSDSITDIGQAAFADTAYFNNTANWQNDMLYIGNHLIWVNTKYSGVYEVKDGTRTIADYAFWDCTSLTGVKLPVSLTSIGDFAFFCCTSLQEINVPAGVTNIGKSAFNACESLRRIQTDEKNEKYTSVDGVLYSKDMTTLFRCPPEKVVSSFTVPDTVTKIEASSFSLCEFLTEVTLPDNITYIGESAFYGCKSLTGITLPVGITRINDHTFYGCENLISIDIPKSVTDIGDYVFTDCESLNEINIPDKVTRIGEYLFYNCGSLNEIILPESVASISKSAFSNCTWLDDVYIYNPECAIEDMAFGYNYSYVTIHGYADSTAQTYAQENDYYFEEINNSQE